MIALAKLSVLVNVPDNDPANGFITDCQSKLPPPAILSFLYFLFSTADVTMLLRCAHGGR